MSVVEAIAAALPSYEIGAEIGRGSWGVVLKGHHRQLARDVAIKQLPTEFASDPDVRRRFVNEARLLASLDHPHIVPIYDYIEREGLCLLVMEYLPGGTVWSHFTTTGITMETSCSLTMATCAGLQYAHVRGVLHRDIKPENLMFSASDTLKVTDFGIAKMVSGVHTMATRAGEVLGSPAYIAPEQATGSDLSPATDVYATAVMLYELLSGRLPFPEDGDPLMVLYRHVHEDPTPILQVAPNVPSPIAQVVMRGLARQVSERYQSAEEFGIAIGEAGASVWGPGWLGRAAVTLMGGGPIQASAERPSQPPGYVAPGYSGTVPGEQAQLAPAASPGASMPSSPPVPVLPTAQVRASYGASLTDIGPGDLVALEQTRIQPGRSPRKPMALALVLALLTLLGAVTGVGAAELPQDTESVVSIQGQKIDQDNAIMLDFSKPIEVTIEPPSKGTSGDPQQSSGASPSEIRSSPGEVRLVVSVIGLPIGAAQASAIPTDTGTTAKLDGRSLQYFAAGEVTGKLSVVGANSNDDIHFRARTRQNSFLTVPGIATIALLLFAAAYMEATMRSMRRGRRRNSGVISLALLSSIFGIGLVLLSWLVQARSPTVIGILVCALLGGSSGTALGIAMARIGERRRPVRRF